jgi:hypothetical protein
MLASEHSSYMPWHLTLLIFLFGIREDSGSMAPNPSSSFHQSLEYNNEIVAQIIQGPLRLWSLVIHYSLSCFYSTLYNIRTWEPRSNKVNFIILDNIYDIPVNTTLFTAGGICSARRHVSVHECHLEVRFIDTVILPCTSSKISMWTKHIHRCPIFYIYYIL